MRPLSEYRSIAFDCDGVILDSNSIKTDAFHTVCLPYGKDEAEAFVEFHKTHGGVSRNEKFQHFFDTILNRKPMPGEVDTLLKSYGDLVIEKLMVADITPSLPHLRDATGNTEWLILSGGNQIELRAVFKKRGLCDLFPSKQIFGSPRSKWDIIHDEVEKGHFQAPVLFIGDSRYDYETARKYSFDFVFVSAWSEWQNPVFDEKVICLDRVGDLTTSAA